MPTRLRPLYPALAVAAVAAALAGAGSGGRTAVTLLVLAVQVMLGLAWFAFTGVGALVPMVVLVAAAAAADLLAWRDEGAGIGGAIGVVALSVVAGLVWQLASRERARVTESIAALVSGVVLVVLAAHLVAVRAAPDGQVLLALSVVAVAVAVLAARAVDEIAPRPRIVAGALRGWGGAVAAVAAATGTGLLVGGAAESLAARTGLWAGFAVGIAAVCADLAVDVSAVGIHEPRRIAASRPLAALLPLACAAPVAYAVARLLAG